MKFRVGTSHSRWASEITDILEAVVAGKVREIVTGGEVGDGVLYHSPFKLANGESVWLARNDDYDTCGSLLPRSRLMARNDFLYEFQ